MVELKEIEYKDITQYDADYIKRSKDKGVPEGCSYFGVYIDDELVSYFAVSNCEADGLFIRRGYVLPQFRDTQEYGRSIWKLSMMLLEDTAKQSGYKYIDFYSTRNPQAYYRMFKQVGFNMQYAGYRKNLGA